MDVGVHEKFSGHLQSELLSKRCAVILTRAGDKYLAGNALFDSGWEEGSSPVRRVVAGLVNLIS